MQNKKQLVFLNSRYATTYNNGSKNSDVVFRLPNPIVTPQNQILTVKVAQFIFHNSIAVVNNNNNSLVIEDSLAVETTLTIPTGNYDVYTLATAIEKLVNDLYVGIDPVTIDYDPITTKYTFYNTEEDFKIVSTSTCFSLLGFTEGQDHSSLAFILLGEHPVNLSGENCIFIDLPSLAINNLNGSTGARTSALSCVPVGEQTGSVVFYDNQLPTVFQVNQESIHEVHVRITQEDLTTLVDFQNQNWNMTLDLEFHSV